MSISACASAVSAAASVGLEVSALADGDTNQNFGAACYVGPRFDTDGSEYELNANGGPGTAVNTWLVSGSSSGVWVEFIRSGGTESQFVGKSNSTRYNLSTNQTFYLLDSSSAGSAITIIGRFRFWDAASGGNELDYPASATWSAQMNDPI